MKKIIGIILFLSSYHMNAIEKKGQLKHGIRANKKNSTHVEFHKKESRRTRDIIKKDARRFKSRIAPLMLSTL